MNSAPECKKDGTMTKIKSRKNNREWNGTSTQQQRLLGMYAMHFGTRKLTFMGAALHFFLSRP